MANKLGRGLAALIPDYSRLSTDEKELSSLRDISISLIDKNKYQPRQLFSDNTIEELSESIKSNGLIQPIVVRPLPEGRFELISGERRFRAVQRLGYSTIPAIVKIDISDQQSMILALIENIQREDINALEQAIAFEKIMSQYHYTQQAISEVLGKSRSSIANTLRLLELGDDVKQALLDNTITEGHARTLLRFKSQEEQSRYLQHIIQNNLSVRESEVLSLSETKFKKEKPSSSIQRLSDSKFRASYKKRGTKGSFHIHFNSLDEFNAIKSWLTNA